MEAMYRVTFTPDRAKDNPTDAEFAVDLLLRHPDRFKPLRPQSMEMRALIIPIESLKQPLASSDFTFGMKVKNDLL